MQTLISRYGLAAHLAILAVAPLFMTAIGVLWVAALAAVWLIMEPTCQEHEANHEARRRVLNKILHDPVTWAGFLLVGLAALRAINGGIAMKYDAEETRWFVSTAMWPALPGSANGFGLMNLTVALSLLIVLQGGRHGLSDFTRIVFALFSSLFAACVAFVLAVLSKGGHAETLSLVACPLTQFGSLGLVFGVYSVIGIVAVAGAFEIGWHAAKPLALVSLCGTAFGAFAFSPPLTALVIASALALVFAYAFFYLAMKLKGSAGYKIPVVVGLASVAAGLLAVGVLPEETVSEKVTVWQTADFLSESFLQIRETLSKIALAAWRNAPWNGTGLGSFAFDVRFGADESDWLILKSGHKAALNGYHQLLVERGLIGAIAICVFLGSVLWSFGRRLVRSWPFKLVNPLAVAGIVVFLMSLVDLVWRASALMPSALVAFGVALAISANPIEKERIHG